LLADRGRVQNLRPRTYGRSHHPRPRGAGDGEGCRASRNAAGTGAICGVRTCAGRPVAIPGSRADSV